MTPEAYATAAQYKTATTMTDTAKDSQIETDLIAVSRFIDGRLGRFFARDEEAVDRIYRPAATTRELWVDDLSDTQVVVTLDEDNDGSFEGHEPLAAGAFELLPYNAALGPEARPYTRIHLIDCTFVEGQRVQVNARFGWPSVPTAIQQATIQFTALWRLETPRATRRIAELGDAIEASPDASRMLHSLINQYERVHYA